jgi:glycosyltransferase involved in cell wall biosynthesis
MALGSQAASVSVVIPCWNVETTIANAIESVRCQEGIELEIICYNDNSQDSTNELLSKWASDGLIKYIRNSVSCGAAEARNHGLNEASGELVQFLDADDILLPGKLQRQANIMRDCTADFVVGAYKFNAMNGSSYFYSPDKDCWVGLIASRLGRTSSNLFRTKSLKSVGGWSIQQKSSQEYELMYRLLKNDARIAMDGVIGTIVNSSSGSISNRNLEDNASRFIELRKKIVNYLENHNMFTEARRSEYQTTYERTLYDLKKELNALQRKADTQKG